MPSEKTARKGTKAKPSGMGVLAALLFEALAQLSQGAHWHACALPREGQEIPSFPPLIIDKHHYGQWKGAADG
jgi:hypothetical protein